MSNGWDRLSEGAQFGRDARFPHASCGASVPAGPGQWSNPASKCLKHLMWVMTEYDDMRFRLEHEGGGRGLLGEITQVLGKEVRVSGPYGERNVCLGKPDMLRKSLLEVGLPEVIFSVRRIEYGMPTYYLCRVRRDWYGMYCLIVEDLYMSHDYPLLDRRFARLMTGGHEQFYLRLSTFRGETGRILSDGGTASGVEIDMFLYSLGRCVFQAAWHSDQRFAFLVSGGLGVPSLRHAVELLYLTLSSDLSALRRLVSGEMTRFFRECHPNPGIIRLLAILDSLDANDMGALAKRGLEAYRRLSRQMNRFLDTEIRWNGEGAAPIQMWKPVIANIGRLSMVANRFHRDESATIALRELENVSLACMNELLDMTV